MDDRATRWLAAGILAALTIMAFAQAVRLDFVRYDDYSYVVENPHLKAGLSASSLRWAFTSMDDCLWAPMMRLSHLIDAQIFGMRAWGHHLSSLALHAANVLLLFWLLRRASGALWPSAVVAAIFALHPLHVEPVAWVASRKDVLSTFFALLALLAYDGYAKKPNAGRYLAVLVFLALALMSKPMAVTLPFVMLLLDYWPYSRLERATAAWRALEKAPLFALSAIVALVTLAAEQRALVPVDDFPFAVRISSALVAYAAYVWKAFLPQTLYVPCMYSPAFAPWWKVLLAAGLLAAVSALACASRKRAPYFLVGWLWFLGTLAPVIGLLKFGHQVMADRFMYLPLVGLALAVCFGLADVARRRPVLAKPLAVTAAMALAGCMLLTVGQVRHWRNSEALFTHTLACDPDNYVGHCNLGITLMEQGRPEAALPHFTEAYRIYPRRLESLNDLGAAYLLTGRNAEAARVFEQVLARTPNDPEVLVNLGAALYAAGDFAGASRRACHALELSPGLSKAQQLLGMAEQAGRSGGEGAPGAAK